MKKITTLLTVVVLTTAFAACKKDKKTDEGAAAPPKTADSTAPKTDPPTKTPGPDCDAFVAAVEKFMACQPESAKGYKKELEAMRDGTLAGVTDDARAWKNVDKMDDAAKKAANDLCKQMLNQVLGFLDMAKC